MTDETFLDVLHMRPFIREEGGMTIPYSDYVLEIPVGALPMPDFIMTDCEPDEVIGAAIEFLKPYLVQAAEKNADHASVGAYIAVEGSSAFIAFKQIYLDGTEYTSMTELKEVGPEKAGEAGMTKIAALVHDYARLLEEGIEAAQSAGIDWLPESFKAFATFYDDDATRDWADCLWFAYDVNEAMIEWLEQQSFEKRAEWCKHPCNNALVIRFEGEADAGLFELKWSPAQGQA